MLSGLLQQTFGDVTDPARLHAELWADSVCKVISCWLPLLMSTVVVGRDLLGSSTQCFPLELVQVSGQPENGTSVPDGNSSSDAFSSVSEYSRQLAEFVNVYCTGQDFSQGKVMFSYQLFAMMLVIQAAVMYAPFLLWNITIGRQVICNVRFITRDTEVLYDRFREQNDQTNLSLKFLLKKGSEQQPRWEVEGNVQTDVPTDVQRRKQNAPQEELVEAEEKWRDKHTICIWYALKQAASLVVSVAGLVVYPVYESISVHSIRENFHCSVEEKFSVICTVPAAKVHQVVWSANMAVLMLNAVVTFIHIIVLSVCADGQPFGDIGIEKEIDETPAAYAGQTSSIEDTGEHLSRTTEWVPLQIRSSKRGKRAARTVQSNETNPRCCSRPKCSKGFSRFNDSYIMHAFFKANIESVEKYNYVKSRLAIKKQQKNTPTA